MGFKLNSNIPTELIHVSGSVWGCKQRIDDCGLVAMSTKEWMHMWVCSSKEENEEERGERVREIPREQSARIAAGGDVWWRRSHRGVATRWLLRSGLLDWKGRRGGGGVYAGGCKR